MRENKLASQICEGMTTDLDDDMAEVDAERLEHVLGVGIDVNLIKVACQIGLELSLGSLYLVSATLANGIGRHWWVVDKFTWTASRAELSGTTSMRRSRSSSCNLSEIPRTGPREMRFIKCCHN